VPSWVAEVALATIAAGATAYRIGTATVEPGDNAPDAWAYVIGLAMAAVLLGRRRWPAACLAVVVLLWLAYHIADYPGGAPAVPLWVALYSVAVAPRRVPGLVVAGALIAVDALARIDQLGLRLFDAGLDGSTVVFAAALLLGESVRGRRRWRAETEARLALMDAEREQMAAQQVAAERVRIAQDLHDVSAHTLAVITVQADVAAELLDDEPDEARRALVVVRRAGREAMAELRAAVAVLRDRGDDAGDPAVGVPPPAPTLARIEQLGTAYGPDGPVVAVRHEGAPRALPRAVEATAYRIAQEAVANAVRHGAARRIDVVLDFRPDGLAMDVRDDGTGGTPNGSGYGIRGMVERAAGLGGSVEAGPAGDAASPRSGFRVRAWLPDGGA
jgi:signal transduction histidine kinase